MPYKNHADKQSFDSQYANQARAAANEIGKIPPVRSWPRRRSAKLSLEKFCKKYHAEKFPLAWAPVQLEMIKLIERAVLDSVLALFVVPRGTGKTTLCTVAVEWALLYGHRSYPMLIHADQDKANRQLVTIKQDFETNELLAADFPEVIYPIKKLERSILRAKRQTHDHKPTYITWTAGELVLPTTKPAKTRGNAGGCVQVAGITGAVRGAQVTLPWGETRRPDLVLVDDPQTRESAGSPKQCKDREETIGADLMGLAGPGKSISAFCTATPIRQGDLVMRMLDNEAHPEWQAVNTPMLTSWPDNMELWHEYGAILRSCWIEKRPIDEAHEFYQQRKAEMSKGAEHYWKQRVEPGYVDALESAMANWVRHGPDAFAAEYQGQPEDEHASDDVILARKDDVLKAWGPFDAGQVPLEATELVGHVDVQKEALIWTLAGVSPQFEVSVTRYGIYPEQHRSYWTLQALGRKLSGLFRGDFESRLLQGLCDLAMHIESLEICKPNGQRLHLSLGLIDAAWGESTETVYRFCREHGKGLWMPSWGVGITAASNPINHRLKLKPGEERGLHWHQRRDADRLSNYVRYDANHWKSRSHQGLLAPAGAGSIRLYDPGENRHAHECFADQIVAEYGVKTKGRNRELTEFRLRPGRDNHYLDNLAGLQVAASVRKIQLPGTEGHSEVKAKRQPVAIDYGRQR